jgi:hypothetical protein
MISTLCYKVIDLNAHDDASPAHLATILNEQAEDRMGTGDELPTHAQSPPGGLHDRACPGPRQHGPSVQTG